MPGELPPDAQVGFQELELHGLPVPRDNALFAGLRIAVQDAPVLIGIRWEETGEGRQRFLVQRGIDGFRCCCRNAHSSAPLIHSAKVAGVKSRATAQRLR